MYRIRTLLSVGLLIAAVGGAARAQEPAAPRTFLSGLMATAAIARGGQADASPLQNLSIHLGGMVSPRGAGLAGVDFDVPTLSLGNGWHGRIDADVLFKANLGGINTAVPVTFDQLYYAPNAAGGHNVYYGGGVGAVLGGHASFDGKIVLGTELTKKIGAEFNVHFTDHDTLFCLFARLHL